VLHQTPIEYNTIALDDDEIQSHSLMPSFMPSFQTGPEQSPSFLRDYSRSQKRAPPWLSTRGTTCRFGRTRDENNVGVTVIVIIHGFGFPTLCDAT
jgi:hypothetical protein